MTEQVCPTCRATIPFDHQYVTWCDQCGWNLQPQQPTRPRNVFETFYLAMGKTLSQALHDDVMKASSLRPTMTLSKLLAFSFAAVVHGVTLVFAVAGVLLLVQGWPNPFAVLGGLLCIGAAVTVRPRVPKVPDTIMAREKAPALHKMADDVARALGTSPVDGIVISSEFNAGLGQVGWRRRKILRLGLPLVSILDGEERVALLAHELAHGVNGDPNRGFFVGTAISSLARWHYLLRPTRIWQSQLGTFAIGAALGNLLSLGLSRIPWLGALVLSHLLWHDSQHAEYLADHLAAQTGGTDAALSMLDKLHYVGLFTQAVHTVSLGQHTGTIFDEVERLVAELPQRELERIRRVERLETSRLDATHPPTARRIEFLKARPVPAPKVVLTRHDLEAIDRELAPHKAAIHGKLLDRHRRSLYY